METKFIFGLNLLVAVPTTLRSVTFASYPSSIVHHVIRGKHRKKARGPIKIIHVMLLGTSFLVFVCLYCFVLYAIEAVFSRRRMSRLTFQKVFCLQTKLRLRIVLFHRNPSLLEKGTLVHNCYEEDSTSERR